MEKRDGRVRLRVQVNQQRAPAFCRNGGGQIDRRGGLPDPALLVRNGDNGSHRRSASARPAPAQPFLIALSPLFCCFFRPSCRPFHDISPSTLVSTTGTGTFVFFAVVMPADRPNGIRKEYVSDLYECKEKLPDAVENSPPPWACLSFFGSPSQCARRDGNKGKITQRSQREEHRGHREALGGLPKTPRPKNPPPGSPTPIPTPNPAAPHAHARSAWPALISRSIRLSAPSFG